MEPQAESVMPMDVIIPEEVKYCPYTGSYVQMIMKAYKKNDLVVMKALIEYRDNMIKRDRLINQNKTHILQVPL